ncbi:galactosylgalactosylxylosylprotein 3-beta-glucuronosyltransferase 3-like [Montipora capricornis]|uniref:galactosylgalactosylxylosylprotein 3-beta-glucuronosyltransferase 3-like n=1 Tax=Montipora capricornis TaxID=246305 RepID=UPI0035F1F447
MTIMNRARCTKRWTLITILGVCVYSLLKHESANKLDRGDYSRKNERKIDGISLEDTTTETNATWKTKEEFLGVLPGEALTGKGLQDQLQRVKKQERNFIEELVKARRTEEGLRRNVIRLSLELRAVNNRIRSLSKEKRNTIQDDASFPTVFVVTPTFKRYVQKAELTRISQAFKLVKKLHWIVVEDSVKKTDLVANFLHNSGLKYTHLNVRTSSFLRRHKNEIRRLKPRGVEQRNLAIEWIRKNINPHRTPGVVYFADDDNTYDNRIFDEMRWVQGVGVWPVAFTGGVRWAGPICKNGQVIGFHANWGLFRPFPIDMAAFAVNIKKLTLDFPKAKFIAMKKAGMLESSLLRQITTVKELEPVTPNCSKVYVWHTRTETPKDSILGERLLIKQGTPSHPDVET